MENIRVSAMGEIERILEYVHDQSFEISEVKHDKSSRTLSIPIPTYSRNWRVIKRILFLNILESPIFQAVLVFHNVSDFAISDRADIGQADINIFLHENDSLIIKCGLPVEINMKVKSIDIELIISDEIVSRHRGFDFSFRPKADIIRPN